MRKTPYIRKPKRYSADKWNEYQKVIKSFDVFEVPEEYQTWIIEALHDEETWNFHEECNGANVVSEPGWKGKYSPPYIRHDYAVKRWGFTIKANREMSQLQIAYGMDPWRSKIRWFGVTFIGMPFYRTVNYIKSIFNP